MCYDSCSYKQPVGTSTVLSCTLFDTPVAFFFSGIEVRGCRAFQHAFVLGLAFQQAIILGVTFQQGVFVSMTFQQAVITYLNFRRSFLQGWI